MTFYRDPKQTPAEVLAEHASSLEAQAADLVEEAEKDEEGARKRRAAAATCLDHAANCRRAVAQLGGVPARVSVGVNDQPQRIGANTGDGSVRANSAPQPWSSNGFDPGYGEGTA